MNFIYEKELARDYALKRKKPWSALVSFLNYLKTKHHLLDGYIIDLGCGNGRNFELITSKYLIGIDNSLEFIKIAKERESQNNLNPQLILSDMNALPLRPKSIDTIFSIAALHHIKRGQNRQLLINQLHTILKKSGLLLITVWRRYQRRFRTYVIKDFLKRSISLRYARLQKGRGLDDFGDIFIPWKVSNLNKTYERYYHLYSKSEIKKLFSHFKILEIRKMGGPTNEDNFFALFKKSN